MPFSDSINLVDVLLVESLSAVPSDVANGKSFIGGDRKEQTGTLPILPSIGSDVILNPGTSYTVEYGKNPVEFNIKAKDLGPITEATATAEDILNNKTAWVNGEKLTGNMPDIESASNILYAGNSITISKGYHHGTGTVKALELAPQTEASATENDIRSGKNAWVNGELVSGIVNDVEPSVEILYAGNSYLIPAGIHSGDGIVEAMDLESQTQGTAEPEDMALDATAWVNGQYITGILPKIPSERRLLTMDDVEYSIPLGIHTGRGSVYIDIPRKDPTVVAPTKENQTLDVGGWYMNGDITILGIDALNYKRPNTYPEDSTNVIIENYDLIVDEETSIGSVSLKVDNWHDNATINVYNLKFNKLIDADGNELEIECFLFIDWKEKIQRLTKLGNIEIIIDLEEETNAHRLMISNIKKANISLLEVFESRQFGDSHDVDPEPEPEPEEEPIEEEEENLEEEN